MTSASPRSILVFSGRYHIISNASKVINCIISNIPALCHAVAEKIFFIYFHYKSMVDNDMPGAWPVWTPGVPLAALIKESIIHWSTQHMKALGHMVSEKIFFMFFP